MEGQKAYVSPKAVSKAETAKTLYVKEKKRTDNIAEIIGVSRATVYRYLKYMNVDASALLQN